LPVTGICNTEFRLAIDIKRRCPEIGPQGLLLSPTSAVINVPLPELTRS
jgi:hypothetical protein